MTAPGGHPVRRCRTGPTTRGSGVEGSDRAVHPYPGGGGVAEDTVAAPSSAGTAGSTVRSGPARTSIGTDCSGGAQVAAETVAVATPVGRGDLGVVMTAVLRVDAGRGVRRPR